MIVRRGRRHVRSRDASTAGALRKQKNDHQKNLTLLKHPYKFEFGNWVFFNFFYYYLFRIFKCSNSPKRIWEYFFMISNKVCALSML